MDPERLLDPGALYGLEGLNALRLVRGPVGDLPGSVDVALPLAARRLLARLDEVQVAARGDAADGSDGVNRASEAEERQFLVEGRTKSGCDGIELLRPDGQVDAN